MEEKKKIGEWKGLLVEELTERLKEEPNFYFSNYLGLKADEVNELRRSLELNSSRYLVVKNAIAKMALESAGFEKLAKFINGGVGILLGGKDPIKAVKVASKFSKTHESLRLRGGYLDGEVIDETRIKYLASLPGRGELITKIAMGVKSPITGFVGVLGNTIKKFVYVIEAIKNAKS